jgi:hypothetical protein
MLTSISRFAKVPHLAGMMFRTIGVGISAGMQMFQRLRQIRPTPFNSTMRRSGVKFLGRDFFAGWNVKFFM